MDDVEGLCRGFLQNAAARQWASKAAAPEEPGAEYLSGFGAGWEAGEVAALALAVSLMSGESPAEVIAEAEARAAIDAAFPFDLHIVGEPGER